jgi:ABC-2 type transport system ATP-binding protein
VLTIQEEGRTVFFSTHILNELERVADNIAIIDRGKLKVSGEIDSLKASVKTIRMTFENEPPPNIEIEGLLRSQGNGRDCLVTVTDYTDDKLGRLRQMYEPASVEPRDLTLDEIFEAFVLGR